MAPFRPQLHGCEHSKHLAQHELLTPRAVGGQGSKGEGCSRSKLNR
jgi:hypothetical protein